MLNNQSIMYKKLYRNKKYTSLNKLCTQYPSFKRYPLINLFIHSRICPNAHCVQGPEGAAGDMNKAH